MAAARQLIGATNPLEAAPGSIRGDFALEVTFNLVHGSDSDESAEREIAIWFPELAERPPVGDGLSPLDSPRSSRPPAAAARDPRARSGSSSRSVVPEVEELAEGDPERGRARERAAQGARPGWVGARGGSLVLGADTEVVLDGRVLGKAGGRGEARARLEALSGRTHTVLGGVVLLLPESRGGEPASAPAWLASQVTFRALDEATSRSTWARASGATAPAPTRSRASARS